MRQGWKVTLTPSTGGGGLLALGGSAAGRRRWMEAEDPFQFLAAAIELKQALAHPDPRQYQSSVPVHMDGSCNGLQHYAALARDLHGGTAVNLVPADRPQDVYTGIADTLRKRVESDSLGGAESAQDVRSSPPSRSYSRQPRRISASTAVCRPEAVETLSGPSGFDVRLKIGEWMCV
jgi:hypothetical protein